MGEGLAGSPSGTRSLFVPFSPSCLLQSQWQLPPPFGKLKNYNLYLFIIVHVCVPQYTCGNQRTIENCWEFITCFGPAGPRYHTQAGCRA